MTGNEKAINNAVAWAKKIANDNSFHYGRTKWGHKYGCYFCGTQGKKRAAAPKGQKHEVDKTYCCNPFVVAAFVHGSGVDKKCGKGGLTIPLYGGSTKSMLKHGFKRVAKPKKISELKKGDVLLTPTHCMLYAGDGKIVHAAHHDNGKKNAYWNSSIIHQKIPQKQWSRVKSVWRYYGSGKFKDDPKKPTSYYVPGKTYVLTEDMNIRVGAGSNKALVPVSKWTADAQKHMKNGMLKKGTKVTCKVAERHGEAIWMRTPSGWICALGSSGKMYLRKDGE